MKQGCSIKHLYCQLRELCTTKGILVLDCNSRGLSFCVESSMVKDALITIYASPALSWRRALYVLVHEVCHWYTLNTLLNKEPPLDKPATESIANREAMRLLAWLGGTSLAQLYRAAYRRERSWAECTKVLKELAKYRMVQGL